jgi:hypothetical protein
MCSAAAADAVQVAVDVEGSQVDRVSEVLAGTE